MNCKFIKASSYTSSPAAARSGLVSATTLDPTTTRSLLKLTRLNIAVGGRDNTTLTREVDETVTMLHGSRISHARRTYM